MSVNPRILGEKMLSLIHELISDWEIIGAFLKGKVNNSIKN